MLETYMHLLKDKKKFWQNMTVVITKISWSNDYGKLSEWQEEMDTWIKGLHDKFIERYEEEARPTILAISQDMSKPNREENKPGTE